jgi:hypothetical protein
MQNEAVGQVAKLVLCWKDTMIRYLPTKVLVIRWVALINLEVESSVF